MLDQVSSVDGADGRRTCASVKPPLIANAKTMSCMNKEQKTNVFAEHHEDLDPSSRDLEHILKQDRHFAHYFTLGSKAEASREHIQTCKNADR